MWGRDRETDDGKKPWGWELKPNPDPYSLRAIGLRLARGELLHVLRVRCGWPEGEP